MVGVAMSSHWCPGCSSSRADDPRSKPASKVHGFVGEADVAHPRNRCNTQDSRHASCASARRRASHQPTADTVDSATTPQLLQRAERHPIEEATELQAARDAALESSVPVQASQMFAAF
eukprot:CAMPEP_0194524042 /NCGR_PEP_ID=MMETSP0253-20130528/59085_1 /TAXON_ID=2966 /ORGANISM="Noctiluca scintillans" /LENGTH=118 /DNA_ID=CAMNT_0039368631 /DNA_START=132 /DNA_END=489 /DNA_ORIENTATION=+